MKDGQGVTLYKLLLELWTSVKYIVRRRWMAAGWQQHPACGSTSDECH